MMVDWVVHFTIDRLKAHPALGGSLNPSQSRFWIALGADQMMHELTHLTLVVIILWHSVA